MTSPLHPGLATAFDEFQQGRWEAAEAGVSLYLAEAPDDPMALHLLGVVFARTGRTGAALAPLQRAADLRPDDPVIRQHLSQVLTQLGQDDAALEHLEASLSLDPDNPAGLLAYARAMMAAQQPLRALGSIERALILSPAWAHAWQCRGEVLSLLVKAGMKRHAAAVESFEKALSLGGDADELNFQLAALGQGAAPSVVPANLVRRLFDAYAPRFEQHLTGSLNYRTPEHLAQALREAGVQTVMDEVWDLGCGTGLCAPLLRPLARRLVGVDLSTRMLAAADARGTYDLLLCDDIVASLAQRKAGIDLVVAADVLVYVGALEAFFDAAARALRSGGVLGFSVEALVDDDPEFDFQLRSTQRFAHGKSYIDRLALAHGFSALHQSRQILREELGQPVQGWLVILKLQPSI